MYPPFAYILTYAILCFIAINVTSIGCISGTSATSVAIASAQPVTCNAKALAGVLNCEALLYNKQAIKPAMATTLSQQIIYLFLLAIPVACIAWTVTHEEVFREPREYCVEKSKDGESLVKRKFFYLFTCEYCFSHYVTIFFLIITKYQLLFDDWRGYLIAGFSLVWIANIYMSLFALIRTDLKKEKIEANLKQEELNEKNEMSKDGIKNDGEAVNRIHM